MRAARTVQAFFGITSIAFLMLTGCEPSGAPAESASAEKGVAAPAPVAPPAAVIPKPVEWTIPQGTTLAVRLDHGMSTSQNRPGDRFTGSLVAPVVIGETTVIPRGAPVSGVVRESAPSGRLKGQAVLSLAVDTVEVGGRKYKVGAGSYQRYSKGHKKRNWTLIGGGSGVGALIGGIASGGTGALIGAGAGAAAGTAGAAFTGRRQVAVPAETVINFRLREPLTVTAVVPAHSREKS